MYLWTYVTTPEVKSPQTGQGRLKQPHTYSADMQAHVIIDAHKADIAHQGNAKQAGNM